MNVDNILKLADLIEANQDHFDMRNYLSGCGTAMCFAGFAALLDDPEALAWSSNNLIRRCPNLDIPIIAPYKLGIDDDIAGRLFHGFNSASNDEYDDAYVAQNDGDFIGSTDAKVGAHVLRQLAETGEWSWDVATKAVHPDL